MGRRQAKKRERARAKLSKSQEEEQQQPKESPRQQGESQQQQVESPQPVQQLERRQEISDPAPGPSGLNRHRDIEESISIDLPPFVIVETPPAGSRPWDVFYYTVEFSPHAASKDLRKALLRYHHKILGPFALDGYNLFTRKRFDNCIREDVPMILHTTIPGDRDTYEIRMYYRRQVEPTESLYDQVVKLIRLHMDYASLHKALLHLLRNNLNS